MTALALYLQPHANIVASALRQWRRKHQPVQVTERIVIATETVRTVIAYERVTK